MRRELSWLLILVLLCPFMSVTAQGLMSLDHTDGLWNTDTIEINQPVTFHIRMNNNTGYNITGSTNGFRVYSPTGAQWDTTVGTATGAVTAAMYEQGIFVNNFSIDGIGADTVGFGGFKLFAPGIPAGFNEIVWTLQIGPIDAAYHLGQICLDSSFYPPISFWKWSTTGGDVYPDWDGPHCFTILDPDAPIVSNLVLSPDSLHFSGMEGAGSPPGQICTISSDGQPLSFTLTENIDWLLLSPTQGTTTQAINVLINSTGLMAGMYVDSVLVSSATASNSPQYLVVTLEIIPPPPVIGVDPEQFYFNAVAGEADPDDKILTITNIGGSTLDWTVSNTESWLSLSPIFGGDLGHVTVSVDITGLPFGDYVDTIVVTDPNATNSPVKVPVFLSVGSDLPIIEVDSLFNYVIVPTGLPSIPPWTITIRNGGAGGMSFWLEEDSPRLFTLTPSSGVAPQDVEVGFKITGGTAGVDYYDTLWVYSNEAINSPVPVVFVMHYVDDPAVLHPGKDTIRFEVFECDMGAKVLMPMDYFLVDNIGGDDPLPFQLIYESDLFWLDYDSAVTPFLITATAKDIQLPLGTYYDTILIVAPKATNSPDTVIVRFDMIAGLVDPEIYLSKDNYIISTQENAGPTPPNVFEILNRYGGCMEWDIDEDVPWLYPDIIAGNVPGIVGLTANAAGFPFGQYADSFYVVATDATNSPRKVTLLMKVWRFHGDWDYNAVINISDLVAMADYLFGGGPEPQPERVVGDLDCNHRIDVSDMTYFSEYLFLNGPIPCGNPY